EIVAVDVILEKETWIDLNACAGMIVHHIFQSQQGVHSLEMIGQPIVGSIKIKSLVLDPCPEIPLSGDEETMSVAKVIVERIAVAELAVVVVETTASGVVQFVLKRFEGIF